MFSSDIDDNSDWIPGNLETVPPGAVLAAMLDDIDINQCSGHDMIRVVKARARQISHYQAQTYQAMTSVVDVMRQDPDEIDFAEEAASAEIAAALRLTRRAADSEMELALELRRRLPKVFVALREGVIDVRRARVLVDGSMHLTMAGARQVIDSIIDDASLLTTGQLRAKLRKLCIQVDPDDAKDRYAHAVENRRVVAEPNVDGTTDLYLLNMPPHRIAAATKRINQIALNLKHNGDTRSIDQLRADVALDLLQGTGDATKPGRAMVDIRTDLPTLTRLKDHPGELAGYGPVIADIARQVAEHQAHPEWRWTLVDPDTGSPIDGGITRRRPTVSQRRHAEARNPTCIHPGCRMPATTCDIDHTIPWAERHTTNTNDLAPLCRYHHTIRHRHGWTYQTHPNGDHTFTTPLGHKYTTSGQPP